MSVIALRNSFHQLIDRIENENLLSQFYQALVYSCEKEGNIWNSLSEEEKEELLAAYKASENEKNLTPNGEVRKKFEKWLKK